MLLIAFCVFSTLNDLGRISISLWHTSVWCIYSNPKSRLLSPLDISLLSTVTVLPCLYGHTSFYALHVIVFHRHCVLLHNEGLRHPCLEQVSLAPFSQQICSLPLLFTFGNSQNVSHSSIVIISVIVICDL